ncbi:TrwN protein [Bartonella sp. MM73XJBT]|uniref:TrwN protein n=1 Tax=Bartonella sp. MM73XJBT TaxID=3019095 RepID=UPI0023620F66|nr:TrwN protein [Bartonella sp. MM73XJBT]
MTISNFIMFAAAYASTLHATVPSAVVMQESWNDICAVNMSDKLPHYPFAPKKTIVTIKQSEHNFDVNLGQMSVENQKWLPLSLCEIFDRCKNLNVIRTALKHCCEKEQKLPQYSAERTVLSFYNAENFTNSFSDLHLQKNASYVEVKTSAPVSEELEETLQFYTRKTEQTIKIESLPASLEEDAFTHKESSAHDAFTVEDSSLERPQD